MSKKNLCNHRLLMLGSVRLRTPQHIGEKYI